MRLNVLPGIGDEQRLYVPLVKFSGWGFALSERLVFQAEHEQV
jgi:hypothetical protein